MKRTLFTTALIASGAVLMIAAGPKADLNQDGQVTKAEFTQTSMERFATADTNGDNFLSEEERKALHAARKEKKADRKFEKLDVDGDGNITRAEMDAKREKFEAKKTERRAEVMEKFDTNLDGTLSEAERTVMHAEREAKRGERKGKRGDRKNRRAQRPEPDANGDGLVSLDEHLAVTEQLFTRLDTNADGVLTKGEGRKRKGRKGKRGGE